MQAGIYIIQSPNGRLLFRLERVIKQEMQGWIKDEKINDLLKVGDVAIGFAVGAGGAMQVVIPTSWIIAPATQVLSEEVDQAKTRATHFIDGLLGSRSGAKFGDARHALVDFFERISQGGTSQGEDRTEELQAKLDICQRFCAGEWEDQSRLAADYGGTGWEQDPAVLAVGRMIETYERRLMGLEGEIEASSSKLAKAQERLNTIEAFGVIARDKRLRVWGRMPVALAEGADFLIHLPTGAVIKNRNPGTFSNVDENSFNDAPFVSTDQAIQMMAAPASDLPLLEAIGKHTNNVWHAKIDEVARTVIVSNRTTPKKASFSYPYGVTLETILTTIRVYQDGLEHGADNFFHSVQRLREAQVAE